MSEEKQENPKGEVKAIDTSNITMANIIYILYMVSPLVGGITGIIGVIMAYVNRTEENPDWVNSHYTYQINTFWKLALFSFIGFILMLVFIGIFVLIGAFIWMVIRCVKGMKAFNAEQPIENPKKWGL